MLLLHLENIGTGHHPHCRRTALQRTSPSPVMRKKQKKMDRSQSPTPRSVQHRDTSRVQPALGHSGSSNMCDAIDPTLEWALLSPTTMDSPPQESRRSSIALEVPLTPDAFATARDLPSPLVPPSPAIQELTAEALAGRTSTVLRLQVPSKGKLAMMA